MRTFIPSERVFVWQSKERAPKPGRIVNLEKSCRGLENSCLHMEICGKMLEKKFQSFGMPNKCIPERFQDFSASVLFRLYPLVSAAAALPDLSTIF